MLGQFLEFSVRAASITSSLNFYRSLGFKDLPVGDILHGPYAAIGDRDIAIGLHEHVADGPVLTFVRQDLQNYLRAFKRRGIEFSFAHVDDDQFHEAGFTGPNGQTIKLIEARTWSPGTWTAHSVTACGHFLEFSMSTPAAEEDAVFWERLGLERVDEGREPQRWIRLAGCGIAIGLHERAAFRNAISFGCESLAARVEYLEAKGVSSTRETPFAGHSRGAKLTAPEGTTLFVLEEQSA